VGKKYPARSVSSSDRQSEQHSGKEMRQQRSSHCSRSSLANSQEAHTYGVTSKVFNREWPFFPSTMGLISN
jgi:hypothetical protein